MIPKILHQIWMQGKQKIPPHLLKIQDSWIKTHPHWQIQIWDEDDLLLKGKDTRWHTLILNNDLSLIQKADVWRCMILDLVGGIYADFDMFALKNMETLLNHEKICLGQSHSSITRVQNSILASVPNHPGWDAVYNSISLSLHTRTLLDDLSVSYNVINTTGPIAWTRAVAKEPHHFEQWPAEYFFSKHVHKGKLNLENDIELLKDSYGYHVQEISWMKGHEAFILHCITAWFNASPIIKTIISMIFILCLTWIGKCIFV